SAIAAAVYGACQALHYSHRHKILHRLLTIGSTLAARSNDRRGAANCLQGLADVALRMADLKGAATYYQQALEEFRQIDARLGAANCLQGLADMALRTDDLKGAATYYQQALDEYRQIDERL